MQLEADSNCVARFFCEGTGDSGQGTVLLIIFYGEGSEILEEEVEI